MATAATRPPARPEILATISADLFLDGDVHEIAADAGTWPHVIQFDVTEVQKSLGGEASGEKPMFVEVLVMHEGYSKKSDGSKNVNYTRKTVEDLARLLPGTLAYLGHQQPGTEEWAYREPVGKYVAGRTEERDVSGVGKVLCAIGKCYVSSAAKAFRTHLREKMAGPVSISGTALFKAQGGKRTDETVGMSRLKSVDFCNPGTPGVARAGVTGVVQEIASSDAAPGAPPMADAPARLSRREIEAEYPEIVQAIVREETEALEKSVREITARAEKAEGQVTSLTAEKTALTGKVEEMTKAHGEAKARAEKAEGTVTEMQKAAKVTAVKDAALAKVDERIVAAKAGKDGAKEAAVLEMAKKRLPGLIDASILPASDDDKNTLAVNAALAKFDAQVADVREMAKSFGGPIPKTVEETAKGGKVETGGDGKRTARDLFVSSDAKAARAEKAAAGK